jgi:hypothetical protein
MGLLSERLDLIDHARELRGEGVLQRLQLGLLEKLFEPSMKVAHLGLARGVAADAIEDSSGSQRRGGGDERGAECALAQSDCSSHCVVLNWEEREDGGGRREEWGGRKARSARGKKRLTAIN